MPKRKQAYIVGHKNKNFPQGNYYLDECRNQKEAQHYRNYLKRHGFIKTFIKKRHTTT